MIKIDDFLIGNGQECFIVFEAGPTHSGLESAKKLAGYAKNAGGQAIKFQILDSEKLILDKSQLFTYKILKNRNSGELEEISEPLYDILKRREMSFQEWEELKNYCDEIGILFFASTRIFSFNLFILFFSKKNFSPKFSILILPFVNFKSNSIIW